MYSVDASAIVVGDRWLAKYRSKLTHISFRKLVERQRGEEEDRWMDGNVRWARLCTGREGNHEWVRGWTGYASYVSCILSLDPTTWFLTICLWMNRTVAYFSCSIHKMGLHSAWLVGLGRVVLAKDLELATQQQKKKRLIPHLVVPSVALLK